MRLIYVYYLIVIYTSRIKFGVFQSFKVFNNWKITIISHFNMYNSPLDKSSQKGYDLLLYIVILYFSYLISSFRLHSRILVLFEIFNGFFLNSKSKEFFIVYHLNWFSFNDNNTSEGSWTLFSKWLVFSSVHCRYINLRV